VKTGAFFWVCAAGAILASQALSDRDQCTISLVRSHEVPVSFVPKDEEYLRLGREKWLVNLSRRLKSKSLSMELPVVFVATPDGARIPVQGNLQDAVARYARAAITRWQMAAMVGGFFGPESPRTLPDEIVIPRKGALVSVLPRLSAVAWVCSRSGHALPPVFLYDIEWELRGRAGQAFERVATGKKAQALAIRRALIKSLANLISASWQTGKIPRDEEDFSSFSEWVWVSGAPSSEASQQAAALTAPFRLVPDNGLVSIEILEGHQWQSWGAFRDLPLLSDYESCLLSKRRVPDYAPRGCKPEPDEPEWRVTNPEDLRALGYARALPYVLAVTDLPSGATTTYPQIGQSISARLATFGPVNLKSPFFATPARDIVLTASDVDRMDPGVYRGKVAIYCSDLRTECKDGGGYRARAFLRDRIADVRLRGIIKVPE
jgi:hypothetical protein